MFWKIMFVSVLLCNEWAKWLPSWWKATLQAIQHQPRLATMYTIKWVNTWMIIGRKRRKLKVILLIQNILKSVCKWIHAHYYVPLAVVEQCVHATECRFIVDIPNKLFLFSDLGRAMMLCQRGIWTPHSTSHCAGTNDIVFSTYFMDTVGTSFDKAWWNSHVVHNTSNCGQLTVVPLHCISY